MSERLVNQSDCRRLRQGGRNAFSRTSYWLAKDHLLVVEVAGYKERYRRFYFRDIQAVIVQANQARLWANFALAMGTVFSAFFLASAWLNAASFSEQIAAEILTFGFSLIAFLCLAGLLINAWRGPTCSVHLRTAVQTQRLRGVSRWRKADELMRELTPLIQGAQGNLVSSVEPDAESMATENETAQNEPESPLPGETNT